MEKNVFIPTFGNRPQPFVGRRIVLDNIMEGLAHPEGHPHRATIVTGQRGTGKTALLLEIAVRAEEMGYAAINVTNSEKMLGEILQLLYMKHGNYSKGKQKLKSINAGAFGFSFGLALSDDTQQNFGFRIHLSLLADELAKCGKGVLLLVDEVQSNTPEMRELAVTYQHLVGEGKNIAIVMAGLPGAVSSVLHDDILTFLNRAHKVVLEPLDFADISLFYTERFAIAGKKIAPDVLDFVVRATRGYPYLMQLIGYHIIKFVGEAKTIEMQIAENAAITAKRDLTDSVHKTCLRPLSDKDIAFLKAMSKDKEGSRIADIQTRMKVSPSYIQQYRLRLISAGIILPERRGRIEFAVPYLGEYLRGELD